MDRQEYWRLGRSSFMSKTVVEKLVENLAGLFGSGEAGVHFLVSYQEGS